jgi:hypothetical protein
MRRLVPVLTLAACLGSVSWVQAEESLAAAAERTKREREARRVQSKQPVKSFTDADLSGSGSATAGSSEEAAESADSTADKPAGGGNAEKPEKTDSEKRADAREEIQKKIDGERQRVQQMDQAIAAAQAEMSDITSFTYGTRRAETQKVIDDAQAEKTRAQKAIEDLQEEARRLGVSVSP